MRFTPAAFTEIAGKIFTTFAPTIAVLSLVAVFTSVMIYVDTRRTSWRFSIAAPRFFGTLLVFVALGVAAASPATVTLVIAAGAIIAKLVPESRFLRDHEDPDLPWTPDNHTARLMRLRSMVPVTNGRFAAAISAAIALTFSAWAALALMLVAELLERVSFFRTVYAPKMPGSPGTHAH